MPRPAVFIAAFSARQIAESARRAGYDALAVDFFGDLDLKAAARRGEVLRGHYPGGFDGAALLRALDRLGRGFAPEGFVYGAGFEDRPELIEAIAARMPILGTDAATLRAVKDPTGFAALCRNAGVAHPDTRRTPPADPAGWLAKTAGGAGGAHVIEAGWAAAAPDVYFQRFVPGDRLSAAFVAAAGRARVLGFSRQWTVPTAESPFRYGGACGPLRLAPDLSAGMTRAVEALAAALPLTGLGSADFVAGADGEPVLLEINPRAGATLDVFESESKPLFALHMDSCAGRLPPAASPDDVPVRAAGLAWTADARVVAPDFAWPDWTSDRSGPGTVFQAGEPFCTVRAEAASEAEAMALFRSRVDSLHAGSARNAA